MKTQPLKIFKVDVEMLKKSKKNSRALLLIIENTD